MQLSNKWLQTSLVVLLLVVCSQSAQLDRDARIVIIGAGLAGLGAADELINRYHFTNVRIIEALDRIGGRVYPIPHEDGYLQMGAQFVHNRDNRFYDLLVQLDAVADDAMSERYNNLSLHTFLVEPGCPAVSERVKQLYVTLVNIAKDAVYRSDLEPALDHLSVGELFEEVFRAHARDLPTSVRQQLWSLLKYWQKFTEADSACPDWKLLPTKYARDFDGWDEYKDYLLSKDGFQSVLDYFKRRIPSDAIRTGSPVLHIDYNQPTHDGVRIIIGGQNATVIQADHVIVTTSIGFLKQNMDQLFHPALPERKRKTIQSLGVGTLDKVLIEWDQPWWPADTTAFNLIQQESCSRAPPLSRLGQLFDDIYVHEWFPNMLLAWVGGEEDPALMEATPEAELIDAALEALKRFTGRSDIPRPKQLIKTMWRSDPYFLGAYAWYTKETQRLNLSNVDVAEPIVDGATGRPLVQFAGEATHSSYYQTTHGAYLSGLREACRLASFYDEQHGRMNESGEDLPTDFDSDSPDDQQMCAETSAFCRRQSVVVSAV